MRPMDEQQQFDELNANRRVKLAPKKVFETSLNDLYDLIANGMVLPPPTSLKKASIEFARKFIFLTVKGLDAPFLFIRTKWELR